MFFFFFSSRRRHTRLTCDWSSDVCSSDLHLGKEQPLRLLQTFLVALRKPSFGLQIAPGGEKARKGVARLLAQTVDADKAAAASRQLVVDCKSIHPRDVLGRRSGRLRRDTRSLTHFTDRLARSHTIGSGSCR